MAHFQCYGIVISSFLYHIAGHSLSINTQWELHIGELYTLAIVDRQEQTPDYILVDRQTHKYIMQ